MAVETLYRSTRDLETTFVDRKLADAHDQMLELAELLTDVLVKNVPGLSEKHAEDASIYMAKNRAVFAAAFKNNASALSELSEPSDADADS
ncbi:YebG family protein [Pseudomonas alliivorans]|nr:YebG family protein [Pseudomonas alliivorans]